MRFALLITLLLGVGFLGKLPAQTLSAPVFVPIYNYTPDTYPDTQGEHLVIYAAYNENGVSSGAYPYVLDTGSFGWATATGTSSFWTSSTATVSGTTFHLAYGNGTLQYNGNDATSTISLTGSSVTTAGNPGTAVVTIANATFGIISNNPPLPYPNWVTDIDNTGTMPPTGPIAPEKAGTFGTLGAGLAQTSLAGGNLSSILGQVPIASTSGMDQGYVIHSGGATATGAYIQIGLPQSELSSSSNPILTAMQTSTGSTTTSTGQSVNLYPENQITGTITLVNAQGDKYSAEVAVIIDSGGLTPHIEEAGSGINNFNPPSQFIDGSGNLASGINFTLTTTGTYNTPGLDWSFTTGSTDFVNQVGATDSTSTGAFGSLNAGITIYHNYDITYDTTKGLVGFNPLNIELNASTLVYQGSYLYQGFGTFNDSLGTGLQQIQWTGSGGFAAQGGNLIVTLGGTASTYTWGSTGASANFLGDNDVLYFGSSTSDSTVIFNNGIDLNGLDRTIVVTQGVSTTPGVAPLPGGEITGNITNGSLTVGDTADFGTLVLSGTNSYNGGTTIVAGTLEFAKIVSMPGTGTVTVDSGATLAVNVDGAGEFTSTGSSYGTIKGLLNGLGGQGTSTVVFQSGSALGIDTTDAPGGTATYSDDITNPNIGLTKLGSGTLILNGINTYSGATTVNNGTLEIDGSLDPRSAVTVETAGTLSGNGTIHGSVTVTGSGTIDFGSSGHIDGTLDATGAYWNGQGSVAGQVTASDGIFTVGSGATLDATAGLNVTGGTLAAADSTATIKGDVNYTSSDMSAYGGVIDGAGKVVTMNAATGFLALAGPNTYTGGSVIDHGTLEFLYTNSMPATGNVTVQNGGTIAVGYGDTGKFTSATSGNGSLGGIFSGLGGQSGSTVTFASGSAVGIDTTGTGSYTYSGDITNVGVGVTKYGPGTLLLTGTNTYTGDTTIARGKLQISEDHQFGTGSIDFTGGALQYGTGYSTDLSSRFGVSSDQKYSIDTNGNNVTFATALDSLRGSLDKSGDGTLMLTATNTYSGGTTIEGGILQIADERNIGDTNDGRINLKGGELLTTDAFPTIKGDINLTGTASILATTDTSDATYTGTFNGDGGVTIGDASDSGTITVTNTSASYTGPTDVAYGTLKSGKDGSFSSTSVYSVESGATLDLNGHAETIAALSGSGTVTMGAGNLTAGDKNDNTTFSGVISGTGSFTKIGDDSITLAGANTYSGPTIISYGSLILGASNAIASASAIALNGGTLNTAGFSPAAFTDPLTVTANQNMLSTIDFGAGHEGPAILQFADSSGVVWTADLQLLDFTVGSDELGFGDSTGLTSDQLADIDLAGYVATGLDPSGFVEFSMIPEPSQYGLMLVLVIGAVLSRRRFSRATANL